MKALIAQATLVVAIACLTFSSARPVQAESCSNDSLKGKYGQMISGELLPGPGIVLPQNGVAMTDFDGAGKFWQTDFVVINGMPTAPGFLNETGTYHVNSNCTGTATIRYTDGSEIELALVVVSQGSAFRTVVSYLTLGGKPVPVNISSSGTRVGGAY